MRAFLAIASLAFVIAGTASASAADRPIARASNGGVIYSAAIGDTAGQIVIWDVQPGVAIRPYWSAPWRYRHYFPVTGKKPKIGRVENWSVRRSIRRAPGYYRYWSTVSAYPSVLPRGRVRNFEVAPAPSMESHLK
jgi:hypothetical protein